MGMFITLVRRLSSEIEASAPEEQNHEEDDEQSVCIQRFLSLEARGQAGTFARLTGEE